MLCVPQLQKQTPGKRSWVQLSSRHQLTGENSPTDATERIYTIPLLCPAGMGGTRVFSGGSVTPVRGTESNKGQGFWLVMWFVEDGCSLSHRPLSNAPVPS